MHRSLPIDDTIYLFYFALKTVRLVFIFLEQCTSMLSALVHRLEVSCDKLQNNLGASIFVTLIYVYSIQQ